jgi:hypothetical protein
LYGIGGADDLSPNVAAEGPDLDIDGSRLSSAAPTRTLWPKNRGDSYLSVLACSLVALMIAGSGAGTKPFETTLQDDAALLNGSTAQVRSNARRIAALGADRVRLTASWDQLAPRPRSRKRPRSPFNATDSRTYPQAGWRRLDQAVVAAAEEGLEIQIDLAFWAPRWAVRRGVGHSRFRYVPNSNDFGRFATAVAKRYSGSFPDPAAPKRPLPAVRMWTTWNEPNNPDFLQPQWRKTSYGVWQPESPHVYRAMHNAAYDSLKRVSNANIVLVGATAATGSNTPGKGGVPPLRFVRELACVDQLMRPLQIPECAGYQPLKADGYSHHPYSMHSTPDAPGRPDDVPIANQNRLSALLHALYVLGRIAQPLPIYDTEYGYESRPPDPYGLYSPDQQARFLGWATFLAWKDPDVRMFAQFLLRDLAPGSTGGRRGSRAWWSDFQTGLYFKDGTPKPAAQAFKLPFWAEVHQTAAGPALVFFGQVRPGTGRQHVRVERLDETTGRWVGVRVRGPACNSDDPDFLSDTSGVFLRVSSYRGPGWYRLTWRRPQGGWESGVPTPVGLPPTSILRSIGPGSS